MSVPSEEIYIQLHIIRRHFTEEDAFLFFMNFTKLLPISTHQKTVHKIQHASLPPQPAPIYIHIRTDGNVLKVTTIIPSPLKK